MDGSIFDPAVLREYRFAPSASAMPWIVGGLPATSETTSFPTTHDNPVFSTAFPNVIRMDRGEYNTLNGGTEVDCFL